MNRPPGGHPGRLLLCSENHSLGEWFEKRLMSIMME